MTRVLFLLRFVYWGVIAYLPFALQNQYVDFVLWSIKNPEAECLKTGVPFVTHIQLFSWALMVLLWPLVVWNLGGRLLWERFKLRKQAAIETGGKDA
jgi:hypothetical protein